MESPSPQLGPGEAWAHREYPMNVEWLNSRPIHILLSIFLEFIHMYLRFFRVKNALHRMLFIEGGKERRKKKEKGKEGEGSGERETEREGQEE